MQEDEFEMRFNESLKTTPSAMKKVVLAHLDRLPLDLQMILKMASALGARVDKEVRRGAHARSHRRCFVVAREVAAHSHRR